MKKWVKLLSLLLTFVCFSLSLISCERNRTYDEAEVKAAAEELILLSVDLNEIYYGKGIDYSSDVSTSSGNYYEASHSSLKKFGIQTIEDLVKKTTRVYTSDYSNEIFETKIGGVYSGEGSFELSRYYQKTDVLTGENICIMVYSLAKVYLTDTVEYDFENMTVLRSKGERVYVSVPVAVTNEEGKSQKIDIEIALIEEENGWRLDSPTYAKYNEYLDYYNDLQNKK